MRQTRAKQQGRQRRQRSEGGNSSTSGWRWAGAGLLSGALLAGIYAAPARWLAWVLSQASQGQVQLLAASGTVWQGQAWLHLAPRYSASYTLASPVYWRLHPHWYGAQLALASSGYTDSAHSAAPNPLAAPLRLQLALWHQQVRWQAQEAGLRLPLDMLQGLGAPWNTLGLSGWAYLQTPSGQWSWQAGAWPSAMQWQIRDVASHLSTLPNLGSYQLNWQPPLAAASGTPPTVLQLHTLSGPLHLEGEGQWQQGRLHFNGWARAEDSAADGAALGHLLTLMGERNGNRSRLRW